MITERRTITPEERIHSWIAMGADPAEARWHAALAAALEAWQDHLIAGRIVTCAQLEPQEAQSFDALLVHLDLPPEAVGVFLPSSLSVHFEPPSQGKVLRRAPGNRSQLLLLGSTLWPQRLLVAELAAVPDAAPGVDVYEKGCRIVAAPLDEDRTAVLSGLAWRHMGPIGEPSVSACKKDIPSGGFDAARRWVASICLCMRNSATFTTPSEWDWTSRRRFSN